MKKPLLVLFVFSAIVLAGFVLSAASSPDYTLHEWGTFTSVSGADGALLPGLEREEEALPGFVKSHDGMWPGSHGGLMNGLAMKGYSRPLHNVTIKMETPVIYFYTTNSFVANVHVGFNGGSISQWFPERAGGETPPPYTVNLTNGRYVGGEIDFAKPFSGSIEWNVQVQPPAANDSMAVFKPHETLTWTYPRQTDSATVRTQLGEAEKFLFYRGVGNFPLPVKFTFLDGDTLQITNNSDSTIPTLLLFNHPTYLDQASFTLLDPLKPGESRVVKISNQATTNWQHDVYAAMRTALVQAGLFPKEADAMLQTWWRSYFERQGLRVFWIVPENFTRSVLPLTVQPTPHQQVRVLVGRSELLTPRFELALQSQFTNDVENPWRGDRFFSAYEARVNTLNAAK